jgi:hypothetical protein
MAPTGPGTKSFEIDSGDLAFPVKLTEVGFGMLSCQDGGLKLPQRGAGFGERLLGPLKLKLQRIPLAQVLKTRVSGRKNTLF